MDHAEVGRGDQAAPSAVAEERGGRRGQAAAPRQRWDAGRGPATGQEGGGRPGGMAHGRGPGRHPQGAGAAPADPAGRRRVPPVALSWSGGKDSTLALARLAADPRVRVAGLLATFNETNGRISMHGVRRELIAAQARSLGLPLWEVPLPQPCSNAEYERRMARTLAELARRGIGAVAFGDLYLADVRAYREQQMARAGLRPLFPLWGEDPAALALGAVAAGLRAVVVCVDPRHLGPEWLGREYDRQFLADLPRGVDPCGERGEFHTFVYDGPGFGRPVAFRRGRRVWRDGFWYLDLVPAG